MSSSRLVLGQWLCGRFSVRVDAWVACVRVALSLVSGQWLCGRFSVRVDAWVACV